MAVKIKPIALRISNQVNKCNFIRRENKNNLNFFPLFLHLSHFSVFLDVSYILELDGKRYAIWLGQYTNKYASLIKLYLIFLMSCEDTSCFWKWWSYLSWVIQRVLNRYTTKKTFKLIWYTFSCNFVERKPFWSFSFVFPCNECSKKTPAFERQTMNNIFL